MQAPHSPECSEQEEEELVTQAEISKDEVKRRNKEQSEKNRMARPEERELTKRECGQLNQQNGS